MNKISDYLAFNGKDVRVLCTNGQEFIGFWTETFSATDNAEIAIENGRKPPGASLLIDTEDGTLVEIYISDVDRIELR